MFVLPFNSVSYMVNSPRSQVVRQDSRPDARQRAAIVAKKIENASRMMAAFGRPMKF